MKKIELSNLSELFFENLDKIGKLSRKRIAGNQTRQGKSKGRTAETFSGEAQRGGD